MVSDQRFPFGEMKEFIVLLDIAEAQLSGLLSPVVAGRRNITKKGT
mgnify:CR=1 FL=1